jgi:phage terminase large subunit-like protein
VSKTESWVNITDWDKCLDPNFDIGKFSGRACHLGIDLSSSQDVTAACFTFEIDGLTHVVPFFWLPEAHIQDRSKIEKIPFDIWARQGHLFLTPGNVIDYEVITTFLVSLCKKVDIKAIGVDPHQSNYLKVKLQEEFGELYQDVSQTYKELAAPTMEAERLIVGNFLRHGGNPVLRWMIDNCSTSRDSTGNVKIDRRSRNAKVDGVSALIDALAVKLKNPETGSWYDTHGILSI